MLFREPLGSCQVLVSEFIHGCLFEQVHLVALVDKVQPFIDVELKLLWIRILLQMQRRTPEERAARARERVNLYI